MVSARFFVGPGHYRFHLTQIKEAIRIEE